MIRHAYLECGLINEGSRRLLLWVFKHTFKNRRLNAPSKRSVANRRERRGRSQSVYGTHATFKRPNTPIDNKSHDNTHDTVRTAGLACAVERTQTTKTKPDHTVSAASVGFSWNVMFGRRRDHVTLRATVVTGDDAFRRQTFQWFWEIYSFRTKRRNALRTLYSGYSCRTFRWKSRAS